MKLIAKGAESNLYLDNGVVVKHRIKKKYRVAELDTELRKKRTRKESKILSDAMHAQVNVPRVIKVDEEEDKIFMEFIDGKLLKDFCVNELEGIGLDLGREIAKMHSCGIVHNDLTTSNIIIKCSGGKRKIYIIDFGLAQHSNKIEDMAVDLVVMKHSLNATGFEFLFSEILEGYKENKLWNSVLNRMCLVEKRVRYYDAP